MYYVFVFVFLGQYLIAIIIRFQIMFGFEGVAVRSGCFNL